MAWGLMQNNVESNVTVGGKKIIVFNSTEMTALQTVLPDSTTHTQTVFDFVMAKRTKYGSEKPKKPTASNDYFVQTKHGTFASIQFYLMNGENILAMTIPHKIVGKNYHFFVVEPLDSKELIAFEEIANKMILIKINNKKTVTAIPNRYEKA